MANAPTNCSASNSRCASSGRRGRMGARARAQPRQHAVASQQVLPKAGTPGEILFMGAPLLDFGHLTPEQRIELAEQLWDSLDPARIVPPEADIELLRARRADLARDGDPGEPWRQTIEELKERGA